MAFSMVFPGQGSQSVDMMKVYGESGVIRRAFDEASAALGEDLWAMVAQGPAEVLAQTVNTQPIMLTAGIAVWRLWNELGGKQPAVLAGHSLGEYAALVAAGSLSLADAVPLVRFRAAAMQEAVPAGTGAMAAILNLENDAIAQACREAAQGECVEPVNFNANGQTVIAGHKAAVERAMEGCKARGAKRAVLLPVSAPFHSALMRPAAERLAIRLRDVPIAAPRIPVLNNVDVAIESEPERIRDSLVRQAYSPVRWVEIVQKITSMGVGTVAECGPGKVLAGMTKRCAEGVGSVALADIAAVEAALISLE